MDKCDKCSKPAEVQLEVLYWDEEEQEYVSNHVESYCHDHDPRQLPSRRGVK